MEQIVMTFKQNVIEGLGQSTKYKQYWTQCILVHTFLKLEKQ